MNEINYLLELGEQNSLWVSLILKTLAGLTAIMVVSFITILFMIIRELLKMRKETKLAKEERKKIEEHEQRLISLVEQVEEMKNTVRDISLEAKKIPIIDNEIRDLITDGLKEEYKPHLMNSIKDFIEKENIMNLNDLKEGLNDKALVEEIKNEYLRTQEIEIPGIDLMKAAYEIKIKKRDLKEVVPQKIMGLGRWFK